jgi:biopolymer transport protein ExbD
MNFRGRRSDEEPEINLIPLIDVLVLTLIFLLVTTHFSKEAQLSVQLPQAVSEDRPEPTSVRVTIDARGNIYFNNTQMLQATPEALRGALAQAAGGQKDPLIVVQADGKAPHEAVVRVMDAARRLGFGRLSFATQAPAGDTP